MKKFIKHIFFFGGLAFVGVNLLLLFGGLGNHFAGGINQKHERLAAANSPKVVLVGGSGVSYGYDTERLEEALGMPVVNMGVFGQLGLRYMLEEIKVDIHSGDYILVIPEYHQFYYFFDGWRGLNELLLVRPQAVFDITSVKQWKTLAKTFPRFYKTKLKGIKASMERSFAHLKTGNTLYNSYGDIIGHHGSDKVYPIDSLSMFNSFIDTSRLEINKEAVQVFGAFVQEMKKKGATTGLVYPTLPTKEYDRFQHRIIPLENQLVAIPDLKIINRPTDELLPNEAFYDTVYHLRAAAAKERTERLLGYLGEVGFVR